MQFKTGDTVIYGSFGVCSVKGLKLMSFSSDNPKENYYVLTPFSNANSTYYVPVRNSEQSLRKPMTEDEIKALLKRAKEIPFRWTDNRQTRSDAFHATLSKGVSAELVALLHGLFQRRVSLNEQKKSLSSTDEAVFSNAEKLLHEELAFSLKIPKDEVNSYISNYFESDA